MIHILLAGSSMEHTYTLFAYRALKSLGHRVTLISPADNATDEFIKVPNNVYVPRFINEMGDKPDLFLAVETLGKERFFPGGILELDIPTAIWLGENHLNFRWSKEYSAMFDYAFWCQYGWMKQARDIYGYGHLHWLPAAADEEHHRDFNLERDIDVGYVGSMNDVKRRIFEKIRKEGVAVEFSETPLRGEDVGRYYSRCKIVLNICARFDLNMRTFEACHAGSLMIGQRVIDEGFYRIFTPGVNADTHDFDDAAKIIKNYLANPERLRQVALAGQKMVSEGHTYRRRFEELLRICSGGVTQRRIDFAQSHLANIKMGLTYQHPQFKLKREAMAELRRAFGKDFLGSALYLFKYGYWRIREKIRKTIWELGKRPV